MIKFTQEYREYNLNAHILICYIKKKRDISVYCQIVIAPTKLVIMNYAIMQTR